MLGSHPGEKALREAERECDCLTRNLSAISEAAAAVHHSPPGIRRHRLERLLEVVDRETRTHLHAALTDRTAA